MGATRWAPAARATPTTASAGRQVGGPERREERVGGGLDVRQPVEVGRLGVAHVGVHTVVLPRRPGSP
ncbi:hypothetical protein [Geodermatophilus amargosae]|uniref:hypothetical protein n=1 Tax=Geodermatophilus amargosae TaxID=1296565 RepID=UPI001FE69997|nr:hypothetical protein [Geodermatophilus amargosae]